MCTCLIVHGNMKQHVRTNIRILLFVSDFRYLVFHNCLLLDGTDWVFGVVTCASKTESSHSFISTCHLDATTTRTNVTCISLVSGRPSPTELPSRNSSSAMSRTRWDQTVERARWIQMVWGSGSSIICTLCWTDVHTSGRRPFGCFVWCV